MKKEIWLYGIACGSGILTWIAISSLSGRTEAWDSESYLYFGIPALCLVACGLGFLELKRPWRWGIVQILGQAVLTSSALKIRFVSPRGRLYPVCPSPTVCSTLYFTRGQLLAACPSLLTVQ
jgi:hypothetical protein